MYALYYSPGSAAMVVHQSLIETGAPFELRTVDLAAREHKTPEYLKLNPNGVVPTLLLEDRPYFECSAMLLLLAERHPEAKLAPPVGSPLRPAYVQWMFHIANSIQPSFREWFNPKDFDASEAEAETVKAVAWRRIEASWNRVSAHLTANGPYMLGDTPSTCDFYVTMLMRWSRGMPKPATQWPALNALATHIKARPSWKRMCEEQKLPDW